jgi:hypothetical protein
VKEDRLGEAAMFLLPSLQLKKRGVEEELHRILVENFGGCTAAAGNIFGYWVGPDGRESYGEHRQFMVAIDEAKRQRLVEFLARVARELDEESILLQTGGAVSVVWAQR